MTRGPGVAAEPDRVLWILWGAMLGGVLVFAVVVRWIMPLGGTGADLGVIPWAAPILAVLAVFAAGFVRGRLAAAGDGNARRTAAIIVWSFAEGAALLGLALVLMTGTLYPAGVGALIAIMTLAYYHPGRFG